MRDSKMMSLMVLGDVIDAAVPPGNPLMLERERGERMWQEEVGEAGYYLELNDGGNRYLYWFEDEMEKLVTMRKAENQGIEVVCRG